MINGDQDGDEYDDNSKRMMMINGDECNDNSMMMMINVDEDGDEGDDNSKRMMVMNVMIIV